MISATQTFITRVPLLLAGFLLCNFAQGAAINTVGQDLVPSGKGWGELLGPGKSHGSVGSPGLGAPVGNGAGITSNGINYHGGPVILGTTNVYYIWYGDWSNNSATTILTDFATGISGSSYFNINTTYYNGNSVHVSNSVASPIQTSAIPKTTSSSLLYPYGKSLSDANITSIVSDAIAAGALPKDPNGVYFVLTSADVKETSGFCTTYCGWHAHSTILGTDIKYSFVGNPETQCPTGCEAQTTSPNSNPGADGMASVIAHELEEAVTDPDLNAWYDRRGQENADKCAWKFGATYSVSNGSKANMNIGGHDYLIQQNWVNASGGYCALSW